MKYEVMHFVNKWVRRTKSLLSARGQETEDQKEHQEKSTRHFIIFSGFSGFIKVHTGKTAPVLAVLKPLSKAFGIFPSFPQGNPNIYTYVAPQMELSVCMPAFQQKILIGIYLVGGVYR